MRNVALKLWTAYTAYVRHSVLSHSTIDTSSVDYWRDEIFCRMLIYLAPISIIGLVPGVYMAYESGMLLVAAVDTLAFGFMILIMVDKTLTLPQRKFIFIAIVYGLSMVLIGYVIISGVGMLYLLAITVITALIYSIRGAYYSATLNAFICLCFAAVIHFRGNLSSDAQYTAGAWLAISSNLILLSFVCTKCMEMLMDGLEATMKDKVSAKSAIKKLNKRLLLATSSAGMGIWEWDIATDHLSWDAGMHKLYSTKESNDSTVYARWLSRLHPEDRDTIHMDLQNAVKGIKDYDTEFRIIRDDLSVRYIRATGTTDKDDKGEVCRMIGANWDITAEKIRQAKLTLSEAQLHAIIENTDANIYSLDTDFRYTAFNHVLAENVKQAYDVDVKRGDRIFDFLESFAPQEAREWRDIYIEALRGKTLKFEKEFHLAGYTKTTAFSITPIFKNAEVIGLSCYGVDITEIKSAQLEIQKLNTGLELKVKERTSELENANKELEAFSYSVSHDLRAPVRALMGFTTIIREEYGHTLTADVQDMFKYIDEGSRRMNDIINDLFTLAKYGKEKMTFCEVDLNILFSEVWDTILFTTPHHATLDMEPMPVVYADRSMLQQVIVNMLSNAIKYSSKKEDPTVWVGYVGSQESYTIYVQDNGAGFDMSQYGRLFGAFQRLHGQSDFEGTGVGLMITKKIIDRHGGTIWAEGKVGVGAKFYFSLPVETAV